MIVSLGNLIVEKDKTVKCKNMYYNLEEAWFFQRESIKEIMESILITLGADIINENSKKNYIVLYEEDWKIVFKKDGNDLYSIVITTKDFLTENAIHILNDNSDNQIKIEYYKNHKFNVDSSDTYQAKISEIDSTLKDTTNIIHKSIQEVLQRGEKLDDLIMKSKTLSDKSKHFYKSSKKLNSWCKNCAIQ